MKKTAIYIAALFILGCQGCKKDWINAKSNSTYTVPQTLDDFQRLLDNSVSVFNRSPYLTQVGTDEFDIPTVNWLPLYVVEKNAHVWEKDIYEGSTFITDWNTTYQQVYYANTVLDGLGRMRGIDDQDKFNNLKGSALFYRAYAFYDLASAFCKPYTNTAVADPGIPLRLSEDFNEPSARGTVEQTYMQILKDVKTAVALLPVTPLAKTRPSKAAAYALIARVNLAKEDYPAAKLYADSALQLYDKLIDFNSLSQSAGNPFPSPYQNDEVLFFSIMTGASSLRQTRVSIRMDLYNSYVTNDLRKSLFFVTTSLGIGFRSITANPTTTHFSGLSVPEMYLIQAEGQARAGNTLQALESLNALLIKRWNKNVPYVPVTAADAADALDKILAERKKELVLRGTRWTDLRRLNHDPKYAVTLTRIEDGNTYTLPPNDPRYVLPIPPDILLLSGIEQNPR